MRKSNLGSIWVAALISMACAGQHIAHAQNYQEPLGPRCYQFDFGSNYGWDRYTNLCNENINITLIFPRTGSYLIADLHPGRSDGTGHSRSEYGQMGEPRIFVCPSEYRPVDDNDHYATINTEHYRCRR